jgi:hypothetical protein
MKRCPECRRDYFDETLLYCLDDGKEWGLGKEWSLAYVITILICGPSACVV